jgi:catechol 2,3-dioxygenase-like lactoylglutathione lyase family enzyme
VDWKLEVVIVPVSDVDVAKEFYTEKVGFVLDVDHRASDTFRIVQLTPRGSACSITIGTGLTEAKPGSYTGMHLVVADIDAARDELVGRGVEVGETHHFEEGRRISGRDPQHQKYNSFMPFSDPDGNTWVVQEIGEGT